jgi:tetratricopeptide (TPR) repeat protein
VVAIALALLAGGAMLAYDPAALAEQPKRVALVTLAVLFLARRLVHGRSPGSRNELSLALIAFGGFVGVSALSLAWGAPAGTFDLALWLAGFGVALGSLEFPLAKRVDAVEWMSAAGGAGSAAYALAQAAGGARGVFLHGGQGNADWLGLWLAATLLPTLALLRKTFAAGNRARWVIGASLAFQLVGLALARSRVAWFALGLGLLLLAAVAFRKAEGARRRVAAAALVLIPVSTAIALAIVPRAIPRLSAAWTGRTGIWSVALQIAVESAPIGAGLGSFARHFLDLQGARLQSLEVADAARAFVNAGRAHSDWLELFAESGPVAPLLLGSALFFAAREHFKAQRAELGAALAVLAVAMVADSPLRQPAIVLVLGGILAATSARPRVVPLRWVAPLLLVASSLLLAVSVSAWLGERLVSRAAQASADERRSLLERAARLDPRSGVASLEYGLALLESGRPEHALRELESSRALLPDVGTDVAIASAELALGRPSFARNALLRALAKNPGSFKARVNLAALELEQENLEQARRHLQAARSLYPGSPRLPPLVEALRRAELEAQTQVSRER